MPDNKIHELLIIFGNEGMTTDSTKKGFQHVLDFQDAIGHSSYNDLLDYYQAVSKKYKGLFLWAACYCLDKDAFLDIIRKVVCYAVIIEEEQRLADIYKERLLEVEDRSKHIEHVEKSNEQLQLRISTMCKDIGMYQEKVRTIQPLADKFLELKRLLA